MNNTHSFMICAYKESPYLEECIQSLRAQTESSIIRMVTSTDNSFIRGLAQKYGIPVFINEDGGIGKDWNFALEKSETDYVTIAHQDDVYFKNYSHEIIRAMETNREPIIAFTDYREIREGKVVPQSKNLKIKEKILKPISGFPMSKFVRRRVLSLGNAICCPSVTYNMACLRNNFQFNTVLKTNLDWLAWEELSTLSGSFTYIPAPLMAHRIHGESATSDTIESNVRAEEDLMLLERFWSKSLARIIYHFYKESEKANENSDFDTLL